MSKMLLTAAAALSAALAVVCFVDIATSAYDFVNPPCLHQGCASF